VHPYRDPPPAAPPQERPHEELAIYLLLVVIGGLAANTLGVILMALGVIGLLARKSG
jgi:hypothetical protein